MRLPITIAIAETRVTPMMIGISTRWIACQANWPMPGQPKTDSTTTMPPIKMPISNPIMAMIGRIAFLNACTRMMRVIGAPLARAVRM